MNESFDMRKYVAENVRTRVINIPFGFLHHRMMRGKFIHRHKGKLLRRHPSRGWTVVHGRPIVQVGLGVNDFAKKIQEQMTKEPT